MARCAAARQLAASLAYDILGRTLPLVFLEARAWDVGPRETTLTSE